MTPEWLLTVPRPENLPDLGRQVRAVLTAHGYDVPLTAACDAALAVAHLMPHKANTDASSAACACPRLTTDDIRDFVESRWPAEYPPGSALSRRNTKENPR